MFGITSFWYVEGADEWIEDGCSLLHFVYYLDCVGFHVSLLSKRIPRYLAASFPVLLNVIDLLGSSLFLVNVGLRFIQH